MITIERADITTGELKLALALCAAHRLQLTSERMLQEAAGDPGAEITRHGEERWRTITELMTEALNLEV